MQYLKTIKFITFLNLAIGIYWEKKNSTSLENQVQFTQSTKEKKRNAHSSNKTHMAHSSIEEEVVRTGA